MTTTALVPVFAGTLAGQPKQLCNARDLHAALGVGRDFTTWLKERIEQYGFADGEDFAIFTAPPIRGAGNRGKRTDYHLTLDMAKELAMVENNERGRQVRRYFIAVEKEARAKVGADATAPALPAPKEKLSTALRDHINRTAHATALRLYDSAHKLLTDCALDNLACGASESDAMQYVEALASYAEDATIINVSDAQELVWAVSDVINAAGTAIASIRRLEQRTGLQLAMRIPRRKNLPANFHKHDRLVQEVLERMTGESAQ